MTDFFRNLTGMVAALVLGTTLIAAATAPAVAPSHAVMTAAAQSNIVARA